MWSRQEGQRQLGGLLWQHCPLYHLTKQPAVKSAAGREPCAQQIWRQESIVICGALKEGKHGQSIPHAYVLEREGIIGETSGGHILKRPRKELGVGLGLILRAVESH